MAIPVNNSLIAILLRMRKQQETDAGRAHIDALIYQLTKNKEVNRGR